MPPAAWRPLDDRLHLGDAAVVRLDEDRAETRSLSPPGTDAPVSTAVADLRLDTADRYQHLGEIARGGMGVIRRVIDHDLGREVAMKVILDLPDEDAVVRFIREARIGGQLEHPGIPPVHELGIDASGNVYFTMKLVRGDSLARRLATLREDLVAGRGDGAFPLVQRLEVFKKVCDAMAFAHAHGVIHRDLKPDNIMVGRFGEVLVMDWGLARLPATGDAPPPTDSSVPPTIATRGSGSSPSSVAQTLQGEILGTPAYMAPEQARGQLDKLDARSDVFALGTILYEMLTLRRAHTGKTVYELLAEVTEGDIVPPMERVRTDAELAGSGLRVPPELDAIVRKAMDRRQRARYASCTALKTDLEQYESGGLVGAARYSAWQRMGRFVRRHRKAMVAAAVVMICAAIAVVAALRAAEEAREAARLENLAAHHDDLQQAEEALAAIRTRLESGDPRGAITATEAFGAAHAEALERVAVDDLVLAYRPEWSARSRELPHDVTALRVAAATRIVQDARDGLPAPDRASPDDVSRARELFRTFADDWLDDPEMQSVPLASLALWLARHHEPTDEGAMRRWIGEAWSTRPGSSAACDAIRLLAAHGSDERRAVMQLHRALSAARSPRARCDLLLDLSDRLARLGGQTPYATRVPAREMAMRCLLQVVTPDGELRPEARDALGETADEAAQRASLLLAIMRRIVAATRHPAELVAGTEATDDPRFHWIDTDTDEVVVAGIREPDQPGSDPWTFVNETRMPLAPLRARVGMPAPVEAFFHPATDGSPPVVTFNEQNGEGSASLSSSRCRGRPASSTASSSRACRSTAAPTAWN